MVPNKRKCKEKKIPIDFWACLQYNNGMKAKKILAIDPGSKGAMFCDWATTTCFYSLKNDYGEDADLIEDIVLSIDDRDKIIAFVEDVGKHVAGNAAQGSIALARNHQNIKTCLYMLGIETVDVSPQRWTKEIGVQVKDERSKEEKLRIRNLPKAEKNRENARNRKYKKDKKN